MKRTLLAGLLLLVAGIALLLLGPDDDLPGVQPEPEQVAPPPAPAPKEQAPAMPRRLPETLPPTPATSEGAALSGRLLGHDGKARVGVEVAVYHLPSRTPYGFKAWGWPWETVVQWETLLDWWPLGSVENLLDLPEEEDEKYRAESWVLRIPLGRSMARARTGEDGRFTLGGLFAEDDLFLRFLEGGRTLATVPFFHHLDPAETVDVGDIRLPNYGTVTGRVQDDQGRPVVGATVALLAPGEVGRNHLGAGRGERKSLEKGYEDRGYSIVPMPSRSLLLEDLFADPRVRTGDDGSFTLASIPPGPRHLVVRRAGGMQDIIPSLVVTPGATTNAGTIQLSPLRRVEIQVLDSKGRPWIGAQVLVKALPGKGAPLRSPGFFFVRSTSVPAGRTGVGGRIRVDGPVEGLLWVSVCDRGTAWAVHGPLPIQDRIQIRQRQCDTTPLTIRCKAEEGPPASALARGLANLGFRVFSPDGGVRALSWTRGDKRPDDKGTGVLFKGLSNGCHILELVMPGLPPNRQIFDFPWYSLRSNWSLDWSFRRREVVVMTGAGTPVVGAVVRVAGTGRLKNPYFRIPPTNTDGTGRARIVYSNDLDQVAIWHPTLGEALADPEEQGLQFPIVLQSGRVQARIDPLPPCLPGYRWVGVLDTDEGYWTRMVRVDGWVAFAIAPPGDSTLKIISEPINPFMEDLVVNPYAYASSPCWEVSRVAVKTGGTTTVKLTLTGFDAGAGQVQGVVKGFRPGIPVRLRVEPSVGVARWVPLGPKGAFQSQAITPGQCRLRLTHAATRQVLDERVVRVVKGGSPWVELVLGGGAITGVVLRDGKALPWESVLVTGSDRFRRTANCNRRGLFRLSLLKPGRYTLRLTNPTAVQARVVQVDVGAGEHKATLEILPARRVRFVPDLKSLMGEMCWMVRFTPLAGPLQKSVHVDPQTYWKAMTPVLGSDHRWVNLPPGSYSMQIWEEAKAAGGAWHQVCRSAEFTVGDQEVIPITLSPPKLPPAKITGRLRSAAPGGRLVGGDRYRIRFTLVAPLGDPNRVPPQTEKTTFTCRTDREGAFKVRLYPGRYKWQVQGAGKPRADRELVIPLGGRRNLVLSL